MWNPASMMGVLVVEVERLARGDTSDQGRVAKTFKFSDTLIITPSKTYDPNNEYDEEYFEFGLFMVPPGIQDHPASADCRTRSFLQGGKIHRERPALRLCQEEAAEGKGMDSGDHSGAGPCCPADLRLVPERGCAACQWAIP